ncbi:MAG: hypothetical protein AAGA23_12255, partial [Pseudomonadota bacterium]
LSKLLFFESQRANSNALNLEAVSLLIGVASIFGTKLIGLGGLVTSTASSSLSADARGYARYSLELSKQVAPDSKLVRALTRIEVDEKRHFIRLVHGVVVGRVLKPVSVCYYPTSVKV